MFTVQQEINWKKKLRLHSAKYILKSDSCIFFMNTNQIEEFLYCFEGAVGLAPNI